MSEIEEGDIQALVSEALAIQVGMQAWKKADDSVYESAFSNAFRNNWDHRIGKLKFGGVWSLKKAKANFRHPASKKAIQVPRAEWCGKNVTVEHAMPVKVLFEYFMQAEGAEALRAIVCSYHVAVVTKDEDRYLNEKGLNQSMPCGWEWGDDPLARWQAAGIYMASDEELYEHWSEWKRVG